MTTEQKTDFSSQGSSSNERISKKASFTLVMSTIAVTLTFLLVAAVYYYNTNTHLTP